MNKDEYSKILKELIEHAEQGMTTSMYVKAIRETMARYSHDAIELITIKALLEKIDENTTQFSSIWWRVRKLKSELEAETANSADEPAVPVVPAIDEEVTENDLPFC